MILAIDVGNTNIVVGAFDNDVLTFSARMSTDKNKLADEYAIDLKDIFALYGMDRPGYRRDYILRRAAVERYGARRYPHSVQDRGAGRRGGVKTGMNHGRQGVRARQRHRRRRGRCVRSLSRAAADL